MLRYISKNENDAQQCAVLIADWRGAVINGNLAAFSVDEYRMVGKSNNIAGLQDFCDRILDLLPAGFVDDNEYFIQPPAGSFSLRATCERLGDAVQEHDAAGRIGGDNGVADAVQSHTPPILRERYG